MAKAVVDPEHLLRFAGNLNRFSSDLRERSVTLHQQFTRLGESWRDQEQERFAEEFTVMLAALERFASSAEQQVPVLMRKAAAIQQYLEGR
ncbi:MAG: WXG100 family type VII secretion target [Planctomycetota bacterium]|jgi:uncharacterized protein YukE|nr:WXG100 family type VII secretion target [Planctomycetota bacterium]